MGGTDGQDRLIVRGRGGCFSLPVVAVPNLVRLGTWLIHHVKMHLTVVAALLILPHPPCISPAVSNMGDMSAKAGSSVLLTMPWGLPQA